MACGPHTLVTATRVVRAPRARPLNHHAPSVPRTFVLGCRQVFEGASSVTAYLPPGTWYSLYTLAALDATAYGRSVTLQVNSPALRTQRCGCVYGVRIS